ncbi:hypothetical protein T492DRAFT_1021962, partial [Pavlovales sp. CCMP2436]
MSVAALDGPPPDILELAIACVEPRDVANALRSCHTFARLDPWNLAFKARWGVPLFDGHNGVVIDVDVEPRESVGKMAYLLRHLCELVSGKSALAKARHRDCTIELGQSAIDWLGDADLSEDYNTAAFPALSLESALICVYRALANCATSKLSRRALYKALNNGLYFLLNNGLYFLLDRTSKTPDLQTDTVKAKRFVVASPRGDLVAFYSLEVRSYKNVEDGMFLWKKIESLTWKLHATVIGVADEPRMAETMRGSHGKTLRSRDQTKNLLDWFDGLLLGPDPFVQPPRSPPGCGEPICLANCKVSLSFPGYSLLSQHIMPPPSPAAVSSLIDSLWLGKVVHPDDLLHALRLICEMVPWSNHVWSEPPGGRNFREDEMYKGHCLWAHGRNGRPTRM